jgi:arylsulfatase A
MQRREFLAGAAASAAPAQRKAPSRTPAPKPGRPPNIVWIMGDDLGCGDLGCYGQHYIKTPNVDRLARQGMRFTDAYAGCTVCAPSRSVLMTGLHTGHTPVRSNPGGVPIAASDVTVAQVLKQAGYATGGFGKWGLGDIGTEGVPWRHGFDEFFGYLHQVHAHWYYPPYLYDNAKRFPLQGNTGGARVTYSHDVIAARALDFIRRSAARPFFCYVPVTIPHWELLVPEDSLAAYRKLPEAAPYVDPRHHYADQPYPRAAYAGMVSRLDRDTGRILDLLDELKLAENTIVFFTGDNGSAERLRKDDFFHGTAGYRGHKQNLYEGGIRVPMIARWPGRIAAGAESDFAWAFQDFLPTAAELAGLPAPQGLDGISVVPTLIGPEKAGREQQAHDFLYWELPTYNGMTGEFAKETPMQAVRMGNWKAVRPKPNGPLEVYDLEQDPIESRDLAARVPRVVERIEAYLKTARTEPRPQRQPEMEPWMGAPR